jgi:hypothetical protein
MSSSRPGSHKPGDQAAQLLNMKASAQQRIGGRTTFELLVTLLRGTDRPVVIEAGAQSREYTADAMGRICVTEVSTQSGSRSVREYQITPDSGTYEEWRALTDDLTEAHSDA